MESTWTIAGVWTLYVESTWSLPGVQTQYQEFIWTPDGVHQDPLGSTTYRTNPWLQAAGLWLKFMVANPAPYPVRKATKKWMRNAKS